MFEVKTVDGCFGMKRILMRSIAGGGGLSGMFGHVQMCLERPRGATRNARTYKIQLPKGVPGGHADLPG